MSQIYLREIEKRVREFGLKCGASYRGKEPRFLLYGKDQEGIAKIPFYTSTHDNTLKGTAQENFLNHLSGDIRDYFLIYEGITLPLQRIKKILKQNDRRKRKQEIKKLIIKRPMVIGGLEKIAVATSILAVFISIFIVLIKQSRITGAFAGTLQKSLIIIPLILIVIAVLLIILNLIHKNSAGL